jgi:hypothetical protein
MGNTQNAEAHVILSEDFASRQRSKTAVEGALSASLAVPIEQPTVIGGAH